MPKQYYLPMNQASNQKEVEQQFNEWYREHFPMREPIITTIMKIPYWVVLYSDFEKNPNITLRKVVLWVNVLSVKYKEKQVLVVQNAIKSIVIYAILKQTSFAVFVAQN